MTAEGALMEPNVERSNASGRADGRLVSVIVPVVERADDLTVLYHAFAGELERRGEEHEFLFVFDGGFAPSAELAALSHENESVRLLSFARTFGETAALRLGIERSRGDVIVTLPAYFQVQPEGIGPLLDALQGGADLVVANRSPRVDSWLNRLQSRGFHWMLGGVTDRRFHDIACGVRVMRRSTAVQRQRLRHRPPDDADAAGDVMEAAIGDPAEHPVEHPRLEPVEPAVHPRRAAGHDQVGAALQGIEQRAHALGLHLEIRRQRHHDIAPAPLDAQPERRGLAERAGEGEQPDGSAARGSAATSSGGGANPPSKTKRNSWSSPRRSSWPAKA